jgi:hypothetical protein
MNKALWVLAAILLTPFFSMAADAPKAELFGGYSYFRANEGFTLNLNGWNASIAGNLNRWLGVVADFSGHYSGESARSFLIPDKADLNSHAFLFGPRFSYRGHDRITPFAHTLLGVSHARASALGLSVKDTAFSTAIGGGIDWKLGNSFSLRALQADWVMTRFGGESQNHARLSFGVVFRLGSD